MSATFPSTDASWSGASTAAMLALAMGGFAIGTGEFAIMGLLPNVARDIGVTIPEAGGLISAYAVGVTLGAPLLAVLCARWPKRRLLVCLAGLYALTNLATAAMPGYWSIAVLRFLSGFPHGTYFGVGALVGAAIAPPGQRSRAVGYMMMGLTVAILAGAPLATWLGQVTDWRAAFVLIGVCALVAAILVAILVPDLPANQAASPLRELGALANKQVWLTLGIAGIGFGGMFCVFSYIKPTLIQVTGLDEGWIPLAMAVFGLGGVLGNLVGPRFADRALMKTIGAILLYAIGLLAAFSWMVQYLPLAVLGVFLLGGIGALAPAMQVRLMDVAGDAQTLAASLNHSAFNFANATGAWIGAMTIAAGFGWTALGQVGALMSLGGLVIFAASVWVGRRE